MRRLPILAVLCLAAPLGADVTGCACDVAKPETLEARECALCREAERQPAEPLIFFLKDTNPRKPNRLLVLPRFHGKGQDALADMTPQQRLLLWSAAIEKAKSLWGDEWGLAVNGETARTQCHAHIHIGKLMEGIETARFVVVDGPAQIPVPEGGTGLWVHPEGSRLHVHLGEQITETVLLR
jgi:diadenosine tetraphosphate (Ap4A) HIT family hydrolase